MEFALDDQGGTLKFEVGALRIRLAVILQKNVLCETVVFSVMRQRRDVVRTAVALLFKLGRKAR